MSNIQGNTLYPFGTGEFYEQVGRPQPTSFFGQSGWNTVPLNWFIRNTDGCIYVSPNANFSPIYAAKINFDGSLVYQDQMTRLQSTTAMINAAVGSQT